MAQPRCEKASDQPQSAQSAQRFFWLNPPKSARSARSAVDGKPQSSLPERKDACFLARESDGIAQTVVQRSGAGYGTDQKLRLRLV